MTFPVTIVTFWGRPHRRARADVGFVKKIGQGLLRDIFALEVLLTPDPRGCSGEFVVLLSRTDAGPEIDERARKELWLLGRLEKLKLPFRVPKAVGVYPDSGRLALVRQFLLGIELDLRSGRQGSVRPWEIVGEIAATSRSRENRPSARALPGRRLGSRCARRRGSASPRR